MMYRFQSIVPSHQLLTPLTQARVSCLRGFVPLTGVLESRCTAEPRNE